MRSALFALEFNEWNYHFLQTNAAMLKRILIIIYIVIVIIRIGKKVVLHGKYITGAHS